MCPWLKRWRKITEGKGTTAEFCDERFNDFFERVRIQSENAEAMELQNAILNPLFGVRIEWSSKTG